MKAPRCEVCGSWDATGYEFADYVPLSGGRQGHPRGYGHFCGEHDAAGYTHLSLGEAITAVMERGPAPPRPLPLSDSRIEEL